MSSTINWGIIGPGKIARNFAIGLQACPNAQLLAVGSRDKNRSKQFAEEFSVPRSYDSYQALTDDKDVDVIYIATPHPYHVSACLLGLEAGKNILCENPLTVIEIETKSVIAKAKETGLLLMEGMWTRFFPAIQTLRNIVGEGIIGDLSAIKADLGFFSSKITKSRLFSRQLAGGALLDVGIYCVSFASMFLNKPDKVTAVSKLTSEGVDECTSLSLSYKNGAVASLFCGITTNSLQQAYIFGEKGKIVVHEPFWKANKLTVELYNGEKTVHQHPIEGNGFNYEASHFMNLIQTNQTDSPLLPQAESLEIIKTIDIARKMIGLKYPFE